MEQGSSDDKLIQKRNKAASYAIDEFLSNSDPHARRLELAYMSFFCAAAVPFMILAIPFMGHTCPFPSHDYVFIGLMGAAGVLLVIGTLLGAVFLACFLCYRLRVNTLKSPIVAAQESNFDEGTVQEEKERTNNQRLVALNVVHKVICEKEQYALEEALFDWVKADPASALENIGTLCANVGLENVEDFYENFGRVDENESTRKADGAKNNKKLGFGDYSKNAKRTIKDEGILDTISDRLRELEYLGTEPDPELTGSTTNLSFPFEHAIEDRGLY